MTPDPNFADERSRSAQRGEVRAGKAKCQHNAPVILVSEPDENYALIDSGNGAKLERYGSITLVRPEAQALWRPSLDREIWLSADAEFTGNVDEEGIGRWRFRGKNRAETWPMQWHGVGYYGRFTSFRHVGVFPEQAAHWRFIEKHLAEANKQLRVLNLFAYTGIASLIAARAGGIVTHVDASKKAVGWAKQNQVLAAMQDLPIRWIVDDAMKFCAREIRRGNRYDLILLDPPKFGRGPKGEKWQLFDNLPQLLTMCGQLLADQNGALVLTAYSIRASLFAMHELMRDGFDDRGGLIESGELLIGQLDSERRLPTSLFCRWIAQP